MEELEYIVKDAVMMCNQGAAPGFFTPTHNTHVKMNGCLLSSAADKAPLVNIPAFGICTATQKPCVPVPTAWQDMYKVKEKGQETLIGKSCMQCGLGAR